MHPWAVHKEDQTSAILTTNRSCNLGNIWVTYSFDVLICSSILQTFEQTTEHQAYKIFLLETENRVMTERIQQLEEANKVCGLCRKGRSESSRVELEGWMKGHGGEDGRC